MEPLIVQGRRIGAAELAEIRGLRQAQPAWTRTQLSVALAQRWQWYNDAGRLKDLAARTLLRKLQARGLIELPAGRTHGRRAGRRAVPPPAVDQLALALPAHPPVTGRLAELRPVRLQLCDTAALRRRVRQWLQQYHYRGYLGPVGENLQYLASAVQGQPLAVMVFGAAAWKVACRDAFIGWNPPQRVAGLARLANQQRFLILPWVHVPQLASHLLALVTHRLAADWQARYGHPIALVETFVDQDRFAGAAYRAAGWQLLGETTGRTRQDRHHRLQQTRKAVWVRPLHPRFRQQLFTA